MMVEGHSDVDCCIQFFDAEDACVVPAVPYHLIHLVFELDASTIVFSFEVSFLKILIFSLDFKYLHYFFVYCFFI
jgi:hypothetical protein